MWITTSHSGQHYLLPRIGLLLERLNPSNFCKILAVVLRLGAVFSRNVLHPTNGHCRYL
uniref:Uncharacterized protein n=1 Tax=Arion vulgaris TaxID=1028688 RepID=A0A0B7BFV8_9EUPU